MRSLARVGTSDLYVQIFRLKIEVRAAHAFAQNAKEPAPSDPSAAKESNGAVVATERDEMTLPAVVKTR